jgi:hypothetical protein
MARKGPAREDGAHIPHKDPGARPPLGVPGEGPAPRGGGGSPLEVRHDAAGPADTPGGLPGAVPTGEPDAEATVGVATPGASLGLRGGNLRPGGPGLQVKGGAPPGYRVEQGGPGGVPGHMGTRKPGGGQEDILPGGVAATLGGGEVPGGPGYLLRPLVVHPADPGAPPGLHRRGGEVPIPRGGIRGGGPLLRRRGVPEGPFLRRGRDPWGGDIRPGAPHG